MHLLGPVIEPLMLSLLRGVHARFGLKKSGLFRRRFARFLLACLHIRLHSCAARLHMGVGDDLFGS
jgi:hypothetical protein